MKIDTNIIINCNNLEEVKDCLDKLKELGFNVCFNNNKDQLVVNQSRDINSFQNYIWTKFYPENFCVNYKTFIKLYNKQIKENTQPNLLVDKNGKILKVNDFKDKAVVYYTNLEDLSIIEEGISCEDLKNKLYNRDYFISEEACQKAEKRNIIRRKLEALAFELNGNKDINWDNTKWKNYIYYDNNSQLIATDSVLYVRDMNIYSYSEDFKDKAIELIGEQDLKDYLINC